MTRAFGPAPWPFGSDGLADQYCGSIRRTVLSAAGPAAATLLLGPAPAASGGRDGFQRPSALCQRVRLLAAGRHRGLRWECSATRSLACWMGPAQCAPGGTYARADPRACCSRGVSRHRPASLHKLKPGPVYPAPAPAGPPAHPGPLAPWPPWLRSWVSRGHFCCASPWPKASLPLAQSVVAFT